MTPRRVAGKREQSSSVRDVHPIRTGYGKQYLTFSAPSASFDTVVIPKIINTVEYIKGELDELEREEFFRLKRSQDKKKADIEAAELEKKKIAAAAASAASVETAPKEGGDSDVVF